MKTKYVFLILVLLTAIMVYAAQLLMGDHEGREPTATAAPTPVASLGVTASPSRGSGP